MSLYSTNKIKKKKILSLDWGVLYVQEVVPLRSTLSKRRFWNDTELEFERQRPWKFIYESYAKYKCSTKELWDSYIEKLISHQTSTAEGIEKLNTKTINFLSGSEIFFRGSGSDPAQLIPDPTFKRNGKKEYLYFW